MRAASRRPVDRGREPAHFGGMIRIVQLTDLHVTATAGERLHDIDTRVSLARVWERAQRDWPQHDAVLLTGDLTEDGSRAGYEHLRTVFGPCTVPVLCVPGNHDEPAVLRQVLGESPFVCAGGVDLGRHWRVELLDSHLPGAVGGRLSAESARRVTRLRDDPCTRFLVLALHHPPVSMATPWLDRCGLFEPQPLLDTVDANPAVRVVTWGHAHQALDARRAQARLLCTPSTNTQFLPGAADFTPDGTRGPGYRVLVLHDDGVVETEVRRLPPGAVGGAAVASCASA